MANPRPEGYRQRLGPRGVNIKRDYPAFTIRLPIAQYGKLVDRAAKNKRSIASEVELIMEDVL